MNSSVMHLVFLLCSFLVAFQFTAPPVCRLSASSAKSIIINNNKNNNNMVQSCVCPTGHVDQELWW